MFTSVANFKPRTVSRLSKFHEISKDIVLGRYVSDVNKGTSQEEEK